MDIYTLVLLHGIVYRAGCLIVRFVREIRNIIWCVYLKRSFAIVSNVL